MFRRSRKDDSLFGEVIVWSVGSYLSYEVGEFEKA